MSVAPSARAGAWTVVVPVKRLDAAKSRLDVGTGGDERPRRDLARAFALDTLAAVRAARSVGRVVLVSSEPAVTGGHGSALAGSAVAGIATVDVVPDPGRGLGAAIAAGVAAAGPGPCAVLLGDLPALRPVDLDDALAVASGLTRGVVPDAEGSGTTLLTAREPRLLAPRFGPGSAAAHAAAGHVALGADLDRLRQDVDTVRDLEAVVRLGVGPETARALAALARPVSGG